MGLGDSENMDTIKVIEKNIEKIIVNLASISFNDWNILVTGGAGFLGSWMCDMLIEQRANVVCLDNFSSGLKENVSHLLDKTNFIFIQTDISEPIRITKEFDLVIHMASRASPFEFSTSPGNFKSKYARHDECFGDCQVIL